MSSSKNNELAKQIVNSLIENSSEVTSEYPESEKELLDFENSDQEGSSPDGEIEATSFMPSELSEKTKHVDQDLPELPDEDEDFLVSMESEIENTIRIEKFGSGEEDVTRVAAPQSHSSLNLEDKTAHSVELQQKSLSGLVVDDEDDDKTIVVNAASGNSPSSLTPETRVGIGAPIVGGNNASVIATAAEVALVQSENLRIAQKKISDLEAQMDRLRVENESLIGAGKTLHDQADELRSRSDNLERMSQESKKVFEDERDLLQDSLNRRTAQVHQLESKVTELETRLHRDLKKIKVRERELENRLELSKLEKEALSRSKDETALDLKRKLSQSEEEIEALREKCRELNHKIDENSAQFSDTVRALRIALKRLEIDNGKILPLQKAE